jgi:RNA polymerase sigma factor (sigma-70 family)
MEAFALSPDAVRVPLPQRLLSDDRLLRLVAAGNPQAFGAVYARYHAPLYAYCRSIVRDPDDAKDALQNTMVKALAALGRGEDRDLPLKPWLFRIAHNESVTLLRRRKPSEPLTDAVSPPVASVEVQAAARERLGQLVEDLQELPERQRSALIMREVNGLSYEDIAATLAITPGAARQTVFEARTALAEYGEGREVACDSIRRSISDGDGRAMRARRVRAHLRSCNSCRDFQLAVKVRRRELHLLAPGLSGGTAMALLQGVLGSGVAGGGAAVTGGAGLLGGSAAGVLASGAAKGVVALVAVSAVGAGATQIAGPSHHHSRRGAAPVASAASAGGSSAASARVADPSTVDAAAALSGQGFTVLPGSAHHRHVSAVARPQTGLDQSTAVITLPSVHGHHAQPPVNPYGAGTEVPPGADSPDGSIPVITRPAAPGYGGWASNPRPSGVHHASPPPAAPATGGDTSAGGDGYQPWQQSGDDTSGDGGGSSSSAGTSSGSGDGGYRPWHHRGDTNPVPSGGGSSSGSGSGSGSGGGYQPWQSAGDSSSTPAPAPAPAPAPTPSTNTGSTGGWHDWHSTNTSTTPTSAGTVNDDTPDGSGE